MSTFKTKVVGLSFHDISSPVVESDYVILRADPTNEFDSNAICVLTGNQQIVGFVANSSKTLSDNNIANGIPYVEGNSLKGKTFEGNVMIEEIVYNEYCVISV